MNDLQNEIVVGGVLSARDLQNRVNIIQSVMKQVMKEGTHFGTIPGCPKPSLYKPGAEILTVTFSISVMSESVEDLCTHEEKRYRVTCVAYAANGLKLGSAVGECSSSEEKYKWRKPVCDAEWEATDVDRKREKWLKDGSRLKQVRTEPSDQANTILQMADKRAYVAVVRKVTGASDIFTQDIEDFEGVQSEGSPALKKPQPKKEAFNSADFREMKAKFASSCGTCNGNISVGSDILYNGKLKKAYHPQCLAPKEEPPVEESAVLAPSVMKNLEKMALLAKVKLLDRIGRDGFESLSQITAPYAQQLLEEFAVIVDEDKQ